MSDAAAAAASITVSPKTCSFWIQRKSRNCKMQVKKGSEFCAEHLSSEKDKIVKVFLGDSTGLLQAEVEEDPRIPCPLDPAHSVYTSKLKAHLKKCNAKDPITMPSYFKADLNLINTGVDRLGEKQSPPKTKELVDRIMKVADEILPEHVKRRCRDDDIESTESTTSMGDTEKHRLQQEALSRHILARFKKDKTVKKKVVVIEFGAGKGGLSSYLWETHFKPTEGTDTIESEFILIDRSNSRCKKDAKMKHEGAAVKRIFIDIKDLDLAELLKEYDSSQTVFLCVSKHLCGAATCLTINSILNYFKGLETEQGCEMTLCVALCCHQCCSWQSYSNVSFLKSVGLILEREDVGGVFDKLKAITSWAVCGRFKDGSDFDSSSDSNDGDTDTEYLLVSKKSKYTDKTTKTQPQKKELIGRLMKRIFDYGRVLKLKEDFDGECEVSHYISEEVTLENAVLLANSHHSTSDASK